MNKGQILFSVVAIAAAMFVNVLDILNVLGPSTWVFFLIAYPLALLGFLILLLNITTGTGVSFSYRPPVSETREIFSPQKNKSPSHINRVVSDKVSSDEHIISAEPRMTFRQALLAEWPFAKVSKNAQWVIVDERGNDITNSTLESFHGIAELRVLGVIESSGGYSGEPDKSQNDESERYTSIDQGVTYYD